MAAIQSLHSSLFPAIVRTSTTLKYSHLETSAQLYAHTLLPMTAASASAYNLPIHSMVSQPHLPPPPSDRALAARRPASVTSRSTTTRRHRSSRSQQGGGSFRPQNEFPNFAQTGDVEIIVSADGQERRYMLHRLILAQCSGFFETGTSEEWSRAQARAPTHESGAGQNGALSRIGEEDERQGARPTIPGPPSGARQIWRYELDWGNEDEEQPMLVQKVSACLLVAGVVANRSTACLHKSLRRRPLPITPTTASPKQTPNASK